MAMLKFTIEEQKKIHNYLYNCCFINENEAKEMYESIFATFFLRATIGTNIPF
uniref:Uncharacterized protein n=1 Tax=Rhizophagus irregularis (strain DAOM 181602 / DAOM 197198 / MUCL 43194) TaxID=747089 RepID=U9TXX5_RHIID